MKTCIDCDSRESFDTYRDRATGEIVTIPYWVAMRTREGEIIGYLCMACHDSRPRDVLQDDVY